MKREELESFLLANGWTRDSFGHFHKGEYRMKMQDKSVRYERGYHTEATQYIKAEKRWMRIRSGYYGKLSIVDGKIAGLTP